MSYSLAELMIVANAAAYDNDGETLVTGIGILPRLAGSLAMKTTNPDLMMTDSESWLVGEPNPVGPRERDFVQKNENWIGYSRFFEMVWNSHRHITCTPTQIDRFGQTNISQLGGTYEQPKVMMLGARGFPGNSICHANSFMIMSHNTRVFIDAEVDMVCTVGYNPKRMARGMSPDEIDLRQIVTDLCVMDFGGPDHGIRIASLHPGITVEQVLENTGFPLVVPDNVPTTPAPTAEQLAVIAELDPHNLRSKQLKDNPPGDRSGIQR